MTQVYAFYDLAFRALHSARIHRAFLRLGHSKGIILTVHHVRSWQARAFAPNRSLEITPEFLERVIGHVRAQGIEFVTMDEAVERVRSSDQNRFAVLTFDDGYHDTFRHALPILQRLPTPATVFITPGFADRTAPLWWLDLEAAIAQSDQIQWYEDGTANTLPTTTPREKQSAFCRIYGKIRTLPWTTASALVSDVVADAALDSAGICATNCLDWDGIRDLAADPLITIGAHSMSHPILSACSTQTVIAELSRSRSAIETQLDCSIRHLAYPNGDSSAAGPREFEIAGELGFSSTCTTRPGLIYAEHRNWLNALPRVSLNGYFQDLDSLDVLLSGAPFLIRNLGGRLDVS